MVAWARSSRPSSARRLSAMAVGQASLACRAHGAGADALTNRAGTRRTGIALRVGVARAAAFGAEKAAGARAPARPAMVRIGVQIAATREGLATRLPIAAGPAPVARANVWTVRRDARLARLAARRSAPASAGRHVARARRPRPATRVVDTSALAGHDTANQPASLGMAVVAAASTVRGVPCNGSLAPVVVTVERPIAVCETDLTARHADASCALA